MDTGKEKAAKCYMPPQTLVPKLVLNLCCTADSSCESIQMGHQHTKSQEPNFIRRFVAEAVFYVCDFFPYGCDFRARHKWLKGRKSNLGLILSHLLTYIS